MTVTVRSRTSAITVPDAVRQRAGFRAGQVLEFKASGGIVTITPKLPTADDYTPEQRREVDALLAEGLDDIRKGRVSPVFNTVDEMLASLKAGRQAKPL